MRLALSRSDLVGYDEGAAVVPGYEFVGAVGVLADEAFGVGVHFEGESEGLGDSLKLDTIAGQVLTHSFAGVEHIVVVFESFLDVVR